MEGVRFHDAVGLLERRVDISPALGEGIGDIGIVGRAGDFDRADRVARVGLFVDYGRLGFQRGLRIERCGKFFVLHLDEPSRIVGDVTVRCDHQRNGFAVIANLV